MISKRQAYLLTVVVMERDRRLTGKRRGQSDAVEAPLGFERESTARFRSRNMLTYPSQQQVEGLSRRCTKTREHF